MKMRAIFPAWARILRGYRPFLSIELTKECPLSCPGCYAYEPEHLNNGVTIRQLTDLRGRDLINGVLGLVRRYRPLHVAIVGGEPLVRFRELEELLPKLNSMGVEVQLTTSAVRPIPLHWASLSNLHIVVSVDGLQPEHDARRAPATYDRILKHIAGQHIIVHCTVTTQLLCRDGYLREFAEFWAARPEVHRIWFSLFTPQQGQETKERLNPQDRDYAINLLAGLATTIPKVHLPDVALESYRNPPASPAECIFAQTTTCISADLSTHITPCQFGGKPECSECGCFASAGFAAIGRFKLGGMVPVANVFAVSRRVGEHLRQPESPFPLFRKRKTEPDFAGSAD